MNEGHVVAYSETNVYIAQAFAVIGGALLALFLVVMALDLSRRYAQHKRQREGMDALRKVQAHRLDEKRHAARSRDYTPAERCDEVIR